MKIHHCYITLLLTIFWVLHGTGFLMCEDQKELPFADRFPASYGYGRDGIRRYIRLEAHGDYAKLKLIARSRKRDYNPGEHVDIKFFVRNDSEDSEVPVSCFALTGDCACLWKLFHSNYDETAKTPKWEGEFQNRKQQDKGILWGRWRGAKPIVKLKPGQEYPLDLVRLNDYFDLTKPDTYELTCFQTSFIEGQKYEPPLQSNTLTFRILEESSQEQTDTKERPKIKIGGGPLWKIARIRVEDDLPYTNPPPGEEVFKQPKPPKNLFYDANQPLDPAKKPPKE